MVDKLQLAEYHGLLERARGLLKRAHFQEVGPIQREGFYSQPGGDFGDHFFVRRKYGMGTRISIKHPQYSGIDEKYVPSFAAAQLRITNGNPLIDAHLMAEIAAVLREGGIIAQVRNEIVPLLEELSGKQAINELLENFDKLEWENLDTGPKPEQITAFIREELDRLAGTVLARFPRMEEKFIWAEVVYLATQKHRGLK